MESHRNCEEEQKSVKHEYETLVSVSETTKLKEAKTRADQDFAQQKNCERTLETFRNDALLAVVGDAPKREIRKAHVLRQFVLPLLLVGALWFTLRFVVRRRRS